MNDGVEECFDADEHHRRDLMPTARSITGSVERLDGISDERKERSQTQAARSSHRSGKPFELPKVERPKQDMADALTVLTAVGVDSDSPRLKLVCEFFQNVEANVKGIEVEREKVQRDYQKIWQFLESLKLESARGQQLGDFLLRALEDERISADEIRAGKLREGRIREPIPHPVAKRAGRRIDEAVARTLQQLAGLFCWSWKECAAAVYVSGADKRSYAAVKKSFRDWDRRNRQSGTVAT
jgi:hypothetical protein